MKKIYPTFLIFNQQTFPLLLFDLKSVFLLENFSYESRDRSKLIEHSERWTETRFNEAEELFIQTIINFTCSNNLFEFDMIYFWIDYPRGYSKY